MSGRGGDAIFNRIFTLKPDVKAEIICLKDFFFIYQISYKTLKTGYIEIRLKK